MPVVPVRDFLNLELSRHLVAVQRSGEIEREGMGSRKSKLQADVFSLNAAGDLGARQMSLVAAGKAGARLLELHGAVLGPEASLPG